MRSHPDELRNRRPANRRAAVQLKRPAPEADEERHAGLGAATAACRRGTPAAVRRGPPSEREGDARPAVRRGARRPRAARDRVGDRLRRRRVDRRFLSRACPAARGSPERAGRAPATAVRQGGGARGRLLGRRRRGGRDDRRRPPGRPCRDPEPPREARRRLRPRLRLEAQPARPAQPPHRLSDLQPGDGARHRRPAARHELRPEGVPRRGAAERPALRRAPSLRAGARAPSRLQHRRDSRQPPAARKRPLPLRARALRARLPRPAHRRLHGALPLSPAAPLRRDRPAARRQRLPDPALPHRPQARRHRDRRPARC